jgi:hypothetical protein
MKEIIMRFDSSPHILTHVVINDLQKAFIACHDSSAEELILSAIVTARKVHDLLCQIDYSSSDIDPEEYCAAV